jgi:hypothetical protein
VWRYLVEKEPLVDRRRARRALFLRQSATTSWNLDKLLARLVLQVPKYESARSARGRGRVHDNITLVRDQLDRASGALNSRKRGGEQQEELRCVRGATAHFVVSAGAARGEK